MINFLPHFHNFWRGGGNWCMQREGDPSKFGWKWGSVLEEASKSTSSGKCGSMKATHFSSKGEAKHPHLCPFVCCLTPWQSWWASINLSSSFLLFTHMNKPTKPTTSHLHIHLNKEKLSKYCISTAHSLWCDAFLGALHACNFSIFRSQCDQT